MPEFFLTPTTTTFTTNGTSFDLQVAYLTAKPNILLVYIDSNGNGIVIERPEFINATLDSDGNLIITSFFDDEANHYSLDGNGNLIYTF